MTIWLISQDTYCRCISGQYSSDYISQIVVFLCGSWFFITKTSRTITLPCVFQLLMTRTIKSHYVSLCFLIFDGKKQPKPLYFFEFTNFWWQKQNETIIFLWVAWLSKEKLALTIIFPWLSWVFNVLGDMRCRRRFGARTAGWVGLWWWLWGDLKLCQKWNDGFPPSHPPPPKATNPLHFRVFPYFR